MAPDLATGVIGVELRGLLDLRSAPTVRTTLLKCLAQCPEAVIIDVSGLQVDTRARLTVFPAALRSHSGPSVALALYGASPQIRGLLRDNVLSGVSTYDDRADALAGVASAQVVRAQRVSLRLKPVPTAPARARELIADACRAWDLDRLRGPAALVISELVSNAVQHAGTDFLVQITRRETYLHLSVRDGSPELPHQPDATPDGGEGTAERGRGLQLVDTYATAWGSNPTADGKVVWATLRAGPLRDD